MFIIALFIIIPRDLFSHAFGLADLRVLLGAFPARRRQIDGRRGRDRDGVLVQIQGWVAIADAGWPEIRPPMAPGQRVLWCLPAGGDCGRARAADVRAVAHPAGEQLAARSSALPGRSRCQCCA